MTVYELVESLKGYPPDAEVLIQAVGDIFTDLKPAGIGLRKMHYNTHMYVMSPRKGADYIQKDKCLLLSVSPLDA